MSKTLTSVLSKSQIGIYLECIAFPERTTYNQPFLCELKGDADIEKLKRAVEVLIAAHPGLNTMLVKNANGEVCMQTPAGACVLEKRMSDAEFASLRGSLVRPFCMEGECLSRFEIYLTDSSRYLFYDIHHCVSDGASLLLLQRELLAAYNGGAVEKECYSVYDHAADERALLGGEAYQKAKEYWSELLAPCESDSAPEEDSLVDKPAQGWLEKKFFIEPGRLEAMKHRTGSDNAAVFTAAMGLVAAKYNGDDSSVINTISSGRSSAKLTDTVGMFVKTFPFVTCLNTHSDTDKFIHEAGCQLARSTDNTLYSFVDMAEDLSLTNSILFAYQNEYADHSLSREEESIYVSRERIYDDAHIEEAKLLIEVKDLSGGYYSLHMGYRWDSYTEQFALGFAEAYICAVRGLLAEEKLCAVSLVGEDELARLNSFNDTEKEFLSTPVVLQFESMAERYPEHTAVVCGKERLSYRELDELSEKIGAYAVSLGLGTEDVAAILVPRCVHIATAALGIQKAGCAYEPLDATYPPERLHFMLRDADAKLLITTRELRELVPEYNGNVLLIEELAELPSSGRLGIAPKPHDLFILLYTSGTTGTPKGVQLEQINISAYCAWHRAYYGVGHDAKVAAYASFGFDASMIDLYTSLTNGATLYIIEEDMRLNFPALDKYFCENGITDAFMTTQVGRSFALETTCTTLRNFSVGGEKLTPADFSGLGFRFYNLYGPTECTILATAFQVDRFYKRVPIGKAVDNFKAYVLDKCGNRLPIGACGELALAGPKVGRGYLNRPEATSSAFLENPFCTEEGYTKLYKTGDIVRFMQDGVIDIIGRSDGQVKVRGFRIELTEVEEVIRRFTGIRDATVTAFDDPAGGKAIAAYIVSDETVDQEALRRFIAGEKPPYMVPAVIMQIDAIPYNQNQKVNRRALPKPEVRHDAVKAAAAAPFNRLEAEIAEMIQTVLHVDVQDVAQPLAELGLASISAIRLAAQIYKKYGTDIAAMELTSGGTLQTIENAVLNTLLAGGEKPSSRPAPEAPDKALRCALSFEQQGVYAECQLDPSSTQYNLPMCIRLPGGTDIEELKKAILAIVSAHAALRSRFTADEHSEIMMEIVPGYTPEISVTVIEPAEFEGYKKAFVRPFDLSSVPTRYEIVDCGSLYLLMDIHHLIADGYSIDLFVQQLCQALDGEPLEHEQCSYYEYVSTQTLLLEDDDFFAAEMAQSENASRLLPDVYEQGLPHSEGSVSTPLDLNEIAEFAESLGITAASVGLAAAQLTVSRYLAESTTAIATISSGRGNMAVTDTIGMFVNTLALTAKIDETQTVADYIRETAENFYAVLAHEHYPFARLSKRFDFHPAISYAWQVGTLAAHSTKNGTLTAEELPQGTAKLPISIFVEEDEQGGLVRICYDESMYSREMMRGFSLSLVNVLHELCGKSRLSDISLTDKRQWEILDSYNRPLDLDYDKHDTAVSRFRRMAALHPDKTAAVYKDKSYTYKQLDELSDRLAAVIYGRVSGSTGRKELSECVVAILSGRSENTFILPLSVLKAGCAYEPLDPSYPPERLNFMVQDAGAVLLLVQDELCGKLNEYRGDNMLISELYAAEPAKMPDVTPAPNDLFVMLYTSGSTGTPKGVQIEHGNIVAFAHGTQLDGFYGEDSITAAYASFGFDVNMADTFCTLLNGGSVHVVPEEIRMELDKLARYFDENGITEILMTTQVGVQFIQSYPKLKTLRYLMMGGEKLPAVDPKRLSYSIINGYGPTENCCGVSMFRVRQWEPNIPLGKPMPTIHGYVLDKTGHRLPAGAAGEYCLSGPQVSRGYLNRPDKTAEAYEKCPFDEFRMYHTGDIVRYRQNGDVEFVGRNDGQVKIRGFRIETKEVEAVIREYPGVQNVTVQAYDHDGGGKYLAAFVVFSGTLDAEKLSAFIRERKPSYMVPASVMQLDSIPLTVNQKVDKKALPKPQVKKAEYVAPRNKAEEDFCRIFGEILGLERVGAADDFFELGGSSITAMRVVLAAAAAGFTIAYQDVFDCATPQELAAKACGADAEPCACEKESGGIPQGGSFYGAGTTETAPDGYDYSEINALLRKNTFEAYLAGQKQDIGDVLLLGATGYLGSHVLNELLENGSGRIICLVRPGRDMSAMQRLCAVQEEYFPADAQTRFAGRVSVLECEEINQEALEKVTDNNLTVINCAASVKHFSKGNDISRANIGSVKALIAWCLAHDSRLVHMSTESIMGVSVAQVPPDSFRFGENVLYAGQQFEKNQYICSKFLAEREIYEAILKHGLNGRVIRLGNLAPRMDGQFQTNFAANSFMNILAAYLSLGAIPYTACPELGVLEYTTMDGLVEFSPIEKVAQAVCLLAKAPRECVCFIASNNRLTRFGDIVMTLADEHNPVAMVDGRAFAKVIRAASADPEKAQRAGELIAYSTGNPQERLLGAENVDNSLTMKVLYSCGFRWPETGSAYIRRFGDKLKEKGFF